MNTPQPYIFECVETSELVQELCTPAEALRIARLLARMFESKIRFVGLWGALQEVSP